MRFPSTPHVPAKASCQQEKNFLLIGKVCPLSGFPDRSVRTENAIRRKFRFKPRRQETQIQHLRTNEQIRIPRIFLIDENEAKIGEIATPEALAMAKERSLDLVEVSPKANPPVCRIMDYGKYLYQQSKQQKVAKAKQKRVETKGIRIGIRTDDHDLSFKKSQAEKFLRQGNKVKAEIILRGREKAHQDLARETLKGFLSKIETPYKIEEDVKKFPAGYNVIIAPVSDNNQ